MRFIYTSDLHGIKFLYEEIKTLIKEQGKFDYLIIGGDLFAHCREMQSQISFINGYFTSFLNEVQVKILFIPGNIDWPGSIKAINHLPKILDITCIDLNGIQTAENIITTGFPYVPPTPLHRKDYELRDLTEDKSTVIPDSYITDKTGGKHYITASYFNEQASIECKLKLMNPKCSIMISHSPPYGNKLDICNRGTHIGSKAVLKKIEEIQPSLSLHGHVHESPKISGSWHDKIGNTICINPGMEANKLHAVLGEIDNYGTILNLEHTIYGSYNPPVN